MASANKEYFEGLTGITGIDPTRLDLMLATAKRFVIRDGIGESNEAFADMQSYYAAHLVSNDGSDSQGTLVSRSVGDVSESFAEDSGTVSWMELYRMLKLQIFGFSGRIA